MFTLGEFKDDQLQSHQHTITVWNQVENNYAGDIPPGYNNASGGSLPNRNGTISQNGRVGTTTRTKEKGIVYLIKVL